MLHIISFTLKDPVLNNAQISDRYYFERIMDKMDYPVVKLMAFLGKLYTYY